MPMGLSAGMQIGLDPRGGGSAAPFDPTSLTSQTCVLWLPSDTTYMNLSNVLNDGPPTDGDVVGRWKDRSGNAYHCTQGTTSLKPIYHTNLQNGLGMVQFDGSDDYLANNSVAAPFKGSDKPYSIAWVFKKANNTGDQLGVAFGDSGSFNGTQGFGTSGTNGLIRRKDDAASSVDNSLGGVGTTAHLAVITHTGTAVSAWLDGTQVLNGAASDVGTINLTSFAVGAIRSNGFTLLPFNGYIGEVAIWSGALSGADVTAANSGFNARWAIY